MTLDSTVETDPQTATAAEGGNGQSSKPKRPRRTRTSRSKASTAAKPSAVRSPGRRLAPDQSIPYVMATSNIARALTGISTASTPDRFTQDFLATKLGMKGGTARAVIPFLKRVGFLNSDGTPTNLYKQFKNPSNKGQALAAATRLGYKSLYEVNEYAHELKPAELKGVILQITGLEPRSTVVPAMAGSFLALKAGADFEGVLANTEHDQKKREEDDTSKTQRLGGLNLGYTINLHLPPTSDIAVFNAIFKSLKEHLLGD